MELMNKPLEIPKQLTTLPFSFKVEYLEEPIISQKPIRFESLELGKRKHLISSDYTRIWAVSN